MALRLPVVLIVAVLALLSSPGRAASVDALSDDVRCLALTVYWEARSLSPRGHRSVAHVALNRVASDDFPESVCEVVYQGGETRYRCQFSWWCDGKADTPTNPEAWEEAVSIARKVLAGETADPTGGALYFHSENVDPPWAETFHRTTEIDGHIFYR